MKEYGIINIRLTVIAAVLAAGACASPTVTPVVNKVSAPAPVSPLTSLAPMIQRIAPAVVNIATTGRTKVKPNPLLNDPFFRRFFDLPDDSDEQDREQLTENLGSGVIIHAAKGYIVTNAHVIEQSDQITVTLNDNRQYKAKIIGTDPETDIAVIQIAARNLTALPIADSDQLQVGDFVTAIGNPFGLGQTVTAGIVSALGRSGLGIKGYENFIQTDASINPGSSGGALVNLHGQLVGINTAILAPSGGNIGISFAIPSNMVSTLVNQLISYGRIQRGQLGVTVQNLTPEVAQTFGIDSYRNGALVTRVIPGSAAADAGLEVGDIVTDVNNRAIRDAGSLRTTIGLLRVGDKIDLKLIRKGKTLVLSTAVGQRPAP